MSIHFSPGRLLGLGLLLGGLSSLPCRPAVQAADVPAEARRPAVYALLHIARHPPGALRDAGPLDPAEPEEYRRLQSLLVRTRRVLEAALRSPSVGKLAVLKGEKDPLAWMEKHVRAELLDTPGVLRVWVDEGRFPEQAALTNAVVAAYFAEVVYKERDQKVQRLKQLRDLRASHEDRLREKREVLRRLAEQLGSGGAELELRKRLALQEIDSLQRERLQARAELRRLRLEGAARQGKAEGAALEAEAEKALDADPELANLRARVFRFEAMAVNYAEKVADPDKLPQYATVKEQLARTKKDLAARRERLRATAVARLQERQHGKLDEQIRLLEKLSAQLDKDLDEAIHSYGRLAREARPLELEEVREEIRAAEELARKIGAQARLLEVEADAPARVILLEEASAPR